MSAVEQPKPDHWLTLADDLRKVADRLATLAGTQKPPSLSPYLSISASYLASEADTAVPIVDAIAAAFGATATTKTEGRGQSRRTQRELATKCGKIHVRSVAEMPNPPTRQEKLQTRVELAARVAELEARLAEGGATR